MKPLQAVGMGLVVVILTASVDGYDLIADPVGWVLVLVGLSALRVPQRGTLQTLATVSLVVSVPLWVPSVRADLNLTDASLAWAASIPEIVTLLLLAHALAGVAGSAEDPSARGWLLTVRTLMVVDLLLPPVVLGGGVRALLLVTAVFTTLSLLLLVVLLFRYSDRPWARAVAPAVGVGESH